MIKYNSFERNGALRKTFLELIPEGGLQPESLEQCVNMSYMQVNGLAEFWEDEASLRQAMANVMSSCVRHNVTFSYIVAGDNAGVHIYIGALKMLLNGLASSLEAVFPGIGLRRVEGSPIPRGMEFGGCFTGIPSIPDDPKDERNHIDVICRGMLGNNFTYMVVASGVSAVVAGLAHQRLLDEMGDIYSAITSNVTGGSMGNISEERRDFVTANYFENLEISERHFQDGLSGGIWRANGYFAADTAEDAIKLTGIIKTCFSNDKSRPEPLRVLRMNNMKQVLSGPYMLSDLMDDTYVHPLGSWNKEGFSRRIDLNIYRYQTVLNSNQLACLCHLPGKEFPGYYVDNYVEFDLSTRREEFEKPLEIGDICSAGRVKANDRINNRYIMDRDDLTRHALIIGITGGGKTNTSKSILNKLWNAEGGRIPFLVIESAKREYWELANMAGFEDLMVFTLGAEAEGSSVKYRINPFETFPGLSLQTHIDSLLSTFKAAFDLFPPLPYILEQAVYAVYADRGWDVVENINRYGFAQYPTLSDLYDKIDVLVEDMGYHQEVQSNVKTALLTRINSLMIGGKGAMLNTPRSVPLDSLLRRPVVLELEDIGDDETKSFVIGILLVQLYEYRKTQMNADSRELSHVLLVEEAHRLLKNVQSDGDARAQSVEFFCNMLAEIRTFGQGIIIADQIPTKLAPDSIKNTNLKIVHRTVARDDRETIGNSMNMTEQQIDYLSSLRRGYAAVYAEGDNRPKCVKLPLVRTIDNKTRQQVIDECNQRLTTQTASAPTGGHAGCAYCEAQCEYIECTSEYINTNVDVRAALTIMASENFRAEALAEFMSSRLMERLPRQGLPGNICALGLVLSQSELSQGRQKEALAKYIAYCN